MTDFVGVSPQLIGAISFGGLRAYGLGYAVDSNCDGTIYLSLVGYRTAVRGIWAALMDNSAIEIGDQLFRRLEGSYLTKTVQLPESGLDHMVILHHQAAITHLEAGCEFYVINESDDCANGKLLERFVTMLDRATVVPLIHTWASELWSEGIASELIQPLMDTRGVAAWRVSADSDAWLVLVDRGIRKRKLIADRDIAR